MSSSNSNNDNKQQESCCLFQCLWIMLWPIVSVALGLALGLIVGVGVTLLVVLLTIVRTPYHIFQMCKVTAITQECFKPCQSLDPILRWVVFLLVPPLHVFFLGVVFVASLTCGTMYYIGKVTQTVFELEFRNSLSNVQSNLVLEQDSMLGRYWKECQNFTENDIESHTYIYFLKGLVAFVPGALLGILPVIPFSIAVLLITLYRVPINLYKTVKIALFTVVLKWDLKIAALLMLPVAHTLFPLVMFFAALVGSFICSIFLTTDSIVSSQSPFTKWGEFEKSLKHYKKAHEEFAGEQCEHFDHPTGIPNGWQGNSYGIPIRRILKWQWDFVVCCILLLIGFPICLVGSILIFATKLLPGILSWWRLQVQCMSNTNTAELLGCWVFVLLGILLTPVGAVFAIVIASFLGTMMSFSIPVYYLTYGYAGGLYAPFQILYEVDNWDFFDLGGFRVLICLVDNPIYRSRLDNQRRVYSNNYEARKTYCQAHWDRFANQCIQSTADLLEKKWVSLDNIQSMEPSILQSIPAAAVLTILVETINKSDVRKEDIWWSIDKTLCVGSERQLDNIGAVFWPKIMELKRLLSKKKAWSSHENLQLIIAMLCNNSDETMNELQTFCQNHDMNKEWNTTIRAKLVELSLALLRVRPLQDRMKLICEHEYIQDDEENGKSTGYGSIGSS